MNDNDGPLPVNRSASHDHALRPWLCTLALVAVMSMIGAGTSVAQNGEANSTDGEAPAGPVGLLTLINNSTIEGKLGESDSPDQIEWWGTGFSAPFQFRTPAIASIKFGTEANPVVHQEGFEFEFVGGDVVAGELVGWSGEAIEIASAQFGTVRVRPSAIRRLHRIEQNSRAVFASLSGLQDWTNTTWSTEGWLEDGDHLKTVQPGATLNGDLRVADRAVVEFEVSWQGKPDFVFAIGVDAEGQQDGPTDGWRFETVGGSLAIVREQEDAADVDMIADLSQRRSIRLTAFVDQIAGKMHVLVDDGKAAGELTLQPNQAEPNNQPIGRGVRLVNRGGDLRLKRLRIARWLGEKPQLYNDEAASIVMSDGSITSGLIERFDAKTNSLLLSVGDREVPIQLADVAAVKLAATQVSDRISQCALFLQDVTRLSGDLQQLDAQNWILTGPHLVDPVRVPRERVRSMIVFQHDGVDLDPGLQLGRLGRLELGDDKLNGRLAVASDPGAVEATANDSTCLHWHPLGSDNAAPLIRSASGRIVYVDKARKGLVSSKTLAMQQLQRQQQKRGLNFGKLFLERVDNEKAKSIEKDAHVIHIRAGDVVACRIESIDQAGVHLTTIDSDDGFVPHDQVKAIEFSTNASPPNLNEAKRNRLLTIPRLQKSSPPTHLICSHTGDILRCHLRKVDAESVTIEVQLEEITIPRERVAQIIWFHADELPEADNGEAATSSVAERVAGNDVEEIAFSYDGMVQALNSDGKRVTFIPTEITEKTVAGISELVGACRFDLFKVDQLIFGDRIASEVSDVAFNRWKLQPADEPLVAQVSMSGPSTGSESPMIGLDAPELNLGLLDGGEFNLSEFRGRIVVLDFWASWCAPCMQTMPLLVEAIDQFDANRVSLISINLEETPEQIRTVIDRHQLNLTVALDIDGVAAARYQATAIPQLVVIGPEGKVQRLYVGGGAGVVDQMTEAIAELID